MGASRSTRWVRVARGLALSSASIFVASLSHVAAGGHAPGPLALTIAMAFSIVICTAVAGRTLSLGRLIAGVALSQLLLHGLFSLDGGGSDGVAGEALVGAGHHGGLVALSASAGASALETDSTMWIAHAIAGVVTVVLIRWGHLTARAVRALARPFRELARRAIAASHLHPVARDRVTVLPESDALLPALLRVCSSSLSRRGPPLLAY